MELPNGYLGPTKAGLKIRKIRLKLGISQQKFGEGIGVSGPCVHGWESGKAIAKSDMQDRVATYTSGKVSRTDWLRDSSRRAPVVPLPKRKAG